MRKPDSELDRRALRAWTRGTNTSKIFLLQSPDSEPSRRASCALSVFSLGNLLLNARSSKLIFIQEAARRSARRLMAFRITKFHRAAAKFESRFAFWELQSVIYLFITCFMKHQKQTLELSLNLSPSFSDDKWATIKYPQTFRSVIFHF